MTTREKAPTILTAEGARRLTDRLVTTLTEAHELLIDLWQGRAWEALDYATWDEFCKAELGDLLMVKLPPAMRREAAAHMKAAGMSYRNIAAPLSVSPASIHADLNPKPTVQKLNAPDGRPRPINPRVRPGSVSESRADQIVRLVAAAGIGGLTVQELCAEAGLHHGQASGGLSRVHRQGRVVRTEVYRNGCAAYTV